MKGRKEKLVYNGKIFKLFTWRQKMFDGTYETYERVERTPGVLVLPIFKGKIAFALERQPGYTRELLGEFGGTMDVSGETPLSTAKRELLEEAGLVSTKWRLIKKFVRTSRKYQHINYLYAALNCKKVSDPQSDREDKIKMRLLNIDDFLSKLDQMRLLPEIELYYMRIKYTPQQRKRIARMLGL